MLKFLCRWWHSPAKALMDIRDMRVKTHCRRCGVAMVLVKGQGWQELEEP